MGTTMLDLLKQKVVEKSPEGADAVSDVDSIEAIRWEVDKTRKAQHEVRVLAMKEGDVVDDNDILM